MIQVNIFIMIEKVKATVMDKEYLRNKIREGLGTSFVESNTDVQ